MTDWRIGDLAVYVGGEGCGGNHPVVHKVGGKRYRRVLGIRPGPFRECKAPYALILEGHPSGGLGSCASKWRKVSPDRQDACEDDFVTLLKRIKIKEQSPVTKGSGLGAPPQWRQVMNALTIHAPPPMPVSDVERIAAAFAQSRMFGVSDPAAALSLCLLAQAEGQHPAIAFRDYSIIQGKPAKKAEAMQRDFLQSGGKIEWVELTDTCAKATFSHPAGGTTTIDWTMERAKAAGLGGKDMWRKYPRQMLRSRVISEGVRTVCPMATSGMYVPEEVADFEPSRSAEQPQHVEAEVIELDARREPAPREKLDGPHTSKTALRKAVNDVIAAVRKAETIEAIDALKAEHKRTINQALRDWPLLIDGDPEIAEDLGLKGELEKRRQELTHTTSFQFLMSLVAESTTADQLQAVVNTHGDAIGELDGAESREFEAAYDAKAAALKNPTPVVAGVFGG